MKNTDPNYIKASFLKIFINIIIRITTVGGEEMG